MIKRIIIAILFSLFSYTTSNVIAAPRPISGDTSAKYQYGIVNSKTYPNTIIVNHKAYSILKNAEIVQQIKRGPSIVERHATYDDISIGDSVYILAQSASVLRVAIERWK